MPFARDFDAEALRVAASLAKPGLELRHELGLMALRDATGRRGQLVLSDGVLLAVDDSDVSIARRVSGGAGRLGWCVFLALRWGKLYWNLGERTWRDPMNWSTRYESGSWVGLVQVAAYSAGVRSPSEECGR